MEDKYILTVSLAYSLGALMGLLVGSAKGVLIGVITFPCALILWEWVFNSNNKK
jgi:hypothetical protein